MNILKSLWILFLIGFVASCAPMTAESPFTATDLSGKLAQGYKQKVDNAVIILDASSSMYDKENGTQKAVQAKNVVLHMNDTLPPLQMQAGLHVFGPTLGANMEDSKLIYGMTAYNAADLAAAVKSVEVGGLTPLAKPLLKSIDDLKDSTGPIAVIIVSDGMSTYDMSPVTAAENLKNAFGDRICIYTILIGNSPVGKKTMEDIAAAGKCGFATTQDAVATSEGMADFVEKVFLEKEVAKPVVQKMAPPPVQEKTITMNLKVLFDFDKDTIRPREQDQLDEFAAFMKSHPQSTAVLEGHTDNYGSEAYNEKLSQRRADSVKKYLVNKFNIDPARLSTKGYGFSRPIATNKTSEGRQENRRVVAVISANVKE
ncbi:MAG: VWA domain-containing protein [Desulfurivibrio sp.]|nr:MAG: VWA domain-containing protein [Desulfurivibrio sp.]